MVRATMTLPKLHTAVVLFAITTLSSGCGLLGGGGLPGLGGLTGPKVPPVYGPYEVRGALIKIGLGDAEQRMQFAIEVPPDKGTVPVSINAHGDSFDTAAAQMTTAFADLKKIGATPGCAFEIESYKVPDSSDGKKWKTGGTANISVNVEGKDPDARITAANACFKALREYILALPKYDSGAPAPGFEMSSGAFGRGEIWSVKDLTKHRDALVKQANDRLKQVQSADAKMWDHADMQCTSAGVVTVAEADSHWITLQLEMLCPVSPAETAAGHQVGK